MSYSTDEIIDRLDNRNSRERAAVQNTLREAAKTTKLKIETETMVTVSRDDIYAAITIVTSDECDMFGYIAFPESSEARRCVKPDFYLFDITLDDSKQTGTAKLRTMDGQVVLDSLLVEVQDAPGDAPNRPGLSIELSHNELKAKRWKPDGGQTPGLHITDTLTIRF